MATPPMLRPRGGEPFDTARTGPDPLDALTVLLLAFIALALFVAAILAVYTYSTPDVEAPLVVAIALGFGLVLLINVVGRGVRRLRGSR